MPHLSWNEIRDRALRFSRDPQNVTATSERAHKQTFYNAFFDVFGLRRASIASFEENVRNLKGNTSAIDLLWKGKLIVEHKSRGEDLSLAATQAFTYIEDLTREDRWDEIPRFVLVSDFGRFALYDLEPEDQLDLPLFQGRKIEPHHFTLADFSKNVRHFAFMLGQTKVRYKPEDEANEKAYARMCELHDALKAGGFSGHELERLLVRLLFCLFAEDNGIFEPETFTAFIRTHTRADGSDLGQHLQHLFEVLDTAPAQRQSGLDEDLAAFPYVNGQLFAERLRTPVFSKAMRDSLLFCCDFQWARISPAVFGSLFQGIMEDRARRQQGAHYTSERDIMKVIRSLFLDELREEWQRLLADRSNRRSTGMERFHEKLRHLQFLDPACGCGNFLVLAYRELRALETEVLRELQAIGGGQARLPTVDVDQFHGIEIGEWPVRIAEVALWLMDHQMNAQASELFLQSFDRLPLRATPHIVHANALRLDWQSVLPASQCSYVLGNPPFVGKHYQNAEQRADMVYVYGDFPNTGDLDFVTAWFVKAGAYVQGTRVPVGFVATNSITQGEQVPVLWSILFQRYHLKIIFAHRTFAWRSESRGAAHVHVAIIGIAPFNIERKKITDYDADAASPLVVETDNITPYLTSGPDTFVTKQRRPLCAVPEMRCGNKPTDDGAFIFTDAEYAEFVRNEPGAARFFRRYTGAQEFINGNMRWCLWLQDAAPVELRALPQVMDRVRRVREFREKSTAAPTRASALTSTRFFFVSQPETTYILIPEVSSERRAYVPMGFVSSAVISANTNFLIASDDLFLFGVLTSAMHMAWLRTVGGRLKSDYRYSGSIVYNNFPWPTAATPAQHAAVESAARAVLAAREPHLPPHGMSTL